MNVWKSPWWYALIALCHLPLLDKPNWIWYYYPVYTAVVIGILYLLVYWQKHDGSTP